MSDDEIHLDKDFEPVDWRQEALRQDRLRGEAVTKLAKIQAVLVEHQHCQITCDVIIDAQAVLDE